MYVYVSDLDWVMEQLTDAGVPVLREAQDLPWGERIVTVADTDGNQSRSASRPGEADEFPTRERS